MDEVEQEAIKHFVAQASKLAEIYQQMLKTYPSLKYFDFMLFVGFGDTPPLINLCSSSKEGIDRFLKDIGYEP